MVMVWGKRGLASGNFDRFRQRLLKVRKEENCLLYHIVLAARTHSFWRRRLFSSLPWQSVKGYTAKKSGAGCNGLLAAVFGPGSLPAYYEYRD
jgi:hypothetical protein